MKQQKYTCLTISSVLIYYITILFNTNIHLRKDGPNVTYKRWSENKILIDQSVVYDIGIYVVGNVMALLKLLGVANLWQVSMNFLENICILYIKFIIYIYIYIHHVGYVLVYFYKVIFQIHLP